MTDHPRAFAGEHCVVVGRSGGGFALLVCRQIKTNRDIADILGMSHRTVNKHLEHIFEKLGVETRAAAAALASRTTTV